MNVAVVDNDRALLRSLQILLEERGHRVRAFGSAEEAAALFAGGQAPDAVIVDYVMPGVAGEELLHRALLDGVLFGDEAVQGGDEGVHVAQGGGDGALFG